MLPFHISIEKRKTCQSGTSEIYLTPNFFLSSVSCDECTGEKPAGFICTKIFQ